MAKCEVCGRDVDLPYSCRRCGGEYCSEHRLPENHSCSGLNEWNDPDGVFDSGFDDSVNGRGDAGSPLDRLTGTGGPLSYFTNNVSYLFLAAMVVVFAFQFVLFPLFGLAVGGQAWSDVFTLSSAAPLAVWTWVISVFSHGGIGHLFGNAIVLFFFGPVLERYIGSRRFTGMFLITGALAGLAQIGLGLYLGNPTSVLGASGAIMAILGMLTVLNPGLKVYLYFVLPIPIWLLAIGYALLSVFGVFGSVTSAGANIAHLAHLTGLGLGLLYGAYLKDQVSAPNKLQLGGGGRMGGPGRGGPGGPGGRF